MDAIDAEYWQKCIRHMIKEAKAYLVLDGVIEPEIASVTFVSFFTFVFTYCTLQMFTGHYGVFAVFPCCGETL